MTDEPVARKALRTAERGVSSDASRLVDAVPGLMREAEMRRVAARGTAPSLAQRASWALPRLAAATAIAVIAATWIVVRDRRDATATATPTPTSVESLILGGDSGGTGDVVFDALLDARRRDG